MPRFFPPIWLFVLSLACASEQVAAAELVARIMDAADKPVADAVLSVTPLDAPAPETPAPGRVEIMQLGEEYRPYVTAVRVGTQVHFPNKDDIQHHLYSVSKPKPFEKPLYDSGSSESVLFDRPGVVTLGCNIHDWMVAYVLVLETPWFAKADEAGLARLSALPAGRYRLELWHPRLGKPLVEELELEAEATSERAFQVRLKPDRRIRRAPVGDTKVY